MVDACRDEIITGETWGDHNNEVPMTVNTIFLSKVDRIVC